MIPSVRNDTATTHSPVGKNGNSVLFIEETRENPPPDATVLNRTSWEEYVRFPVVTTAPEGFM
jgi:hypothetical protein